MEDGVKYRFYDREDRLDKLIRTNPGDLVDIYGETGIGKSRLLQEAASRIRQENQDALVVTIDLDSVAGAPEEDKPLLLVRSIASQMRAEPEREAAPEPDRAAELAGEITRKAIQLSRKGTLLYIIIDTTEKFQEDMSFWRWLEENLVGPLLLETQTRLIFSGRVPAPWRRWEVRRSVKLIQIDPLKVETAAAGLAREILQEKSSTAISTSQLDRLVDLVLEFSFGHPEMTELLAEYIAANLKDIHSVDAGFKQRMCQERIEPFINTSFFEGIDETWKRILWSASILNWFDPAILQLFLKKALPELPPASDWFYIEGINMLRIRKTVVWREAEGDRLHGVIRDIVRQCLKVIDHAQYRRALQAARDTFTEIAGEFDENDDETAIYIEEANRFATIA